MNCFYCLWQNLIDAIKGISVSCNVPQPFKSECTIENPVEVTGTITTTMTDVCNETMAKILSQSSDFTKIAFKNGEQYQKVSNLTVDGSLVSFETQGQKLQTVLCNIEYAII